MLAYLALPAGRVHSRDALAALLWAESPEEQSRASLRHVLAVTRRAIGSTARRCLITDADTVALDPRGVDVDVATFEHLVARGDPSQFERAVRLYSGDLLAGLRMSDAPFEEWLLHERERLRELALDALARLLAAHRRDGDTAAAIQAGLRLLTLDSPGSPCTAPSSSCTRAPGGHHAAFGMRPRMVTVLCGALLCANPPGVTTSDLVKFLRRRGEARPRRRWRNAPGPSCRTRCLRRSMSP